MLYPLFERQKQSLLSFYQGLSVADAERVLETLLACQGTILTTGVGKSGFIAAKIAATLLSTGTQAAFLPPSDAMHGDLARAQEGDLVLAFSKSGETQELLDLIPYLEGRGVLVVAITSNPSSRLARACPLSLHLPLDRELCPFDLAPTTSTVLQLLIGDALAIALMNRKEITRERFASNHPGGLIGRRIALKVKDVMLKGEALPLCSPRQTLIEILPELSSKRCGCLIAQDAEGKLKGIFTDGDLRRSLETKGSKALEATVEQLMTERPRTAHPDELAWDAMRRMEDPTRPVTALPVVEESRVVGLIRMHDILQEEIC